MTNVSEDKQPIGAGPASRVSAIIVQKIAPEKTNAFLTWQQEITNATKAFAGYERTEVFPPIAEIQDEWVTIVHFQSNEALDKWLKSDTRAALNGRFNEEFGEFDLRKVASGLGFWFAAGTSGGPPGWKMVLTVLFALYPSVVLVSVAVLPLLKGWSFAEKMLLANLMTVSMLQYLIMPVLRKYLAWWHAPPEGKERNYTVAGTALLIVLLGAMALVFNTLNL